ncbi:hypothetical protein EJB05_10422 [Eragrostis curvula]|uniref:Negatively light-regulated protein n=1 Tax=Eragrostis curvula TaxID=38414 RepID=A0A5J9VNQ2_9POAL|nr:hypothetical protein EJB05_10422 [Eragrostis curvula]
MMDIPCWDFNDLGISELQPFVEKKYGGITPKKPLISKDHERAYFDSADWVLGKQGANSGSAQAAIESLKPKLKDSSSPASPAQADLRLQLSQGIKGLLGDGEFLRRYRDWD